jgi:hypothetical protein
LRSLVGGIKLFGKLRSHKKLSVSFGFAYTTGFSQARIIDLEEA